MYDDKKEMDDLPDLDTADSSGGIKAWSHKIFTKSETIIPILLIVLFLGIFAVNFMDINIPIISDFVGNSYTSVLVLGSPAQITQDMFSSDSFERKYRFRTMDPDNLDRQPLKVIKKYDIVIIDQSESAKRSIPDALSTALQSYVKSGGSLVIVADSAYLKNNRPDAFGWVSTLGTGVAPVSCQQNQDYTRPCENGTTINAVLKNYDPSNKVLEGIDQIPASLELGASLPPITTFDIQPLGNEWMTIKNVVTGKTYPGIVYKKSWLGEVVYFNFNEIGLIPDVVDRVLQKLS